MPKIPKKAERKETYVVPCGVFATAVYILQCFIFALSCIVLLCAFTTFWLLDTYFCSVSISLTLEALFYSSLWYTFFSCMVFVFNMYSMRDAFICLYEVFCKYYD